MIEGQEYVVDYQCKEMEMGKPEITDVLQEMIINSEPEVYRDDHQ